MKRIPLFIFAITFITNVITAHIAPKIADAIQTLLSVTTFDEQNKIIASGNGFYSSKNGEAIASYKLFKGAKRAIVIDGKGKKWEVKRILGASDMLNLVKFQVENKETKALAPALDLAKVDETLYLVSKFPKKGSLIETKVTHVTTYSGSAYYTLSLSDNDKNENCPILNAEGKVVAIVQKNVNKKTTNAYAIGIQLAINMQIDELSVGNRSLLGIGITKALPTTQEKALTYLYLLSSSNVDSTTYRTALNDFIETYPESQEGYTERAMFYAEHKDYAKSEADFEKALNVAQQKDQVYYALSKAIYNKALYSPTPIYKDWNLTRALTEAQNAYTSQPHSIYLIMQGKCYYGLKNYEKAYQLYSDLNKTNFASAETFYYAAKAKEMNGGDLKEVIELMDSAISKCPKPYTKDAAPYLFDRAIKNVLAGNYREAVLDYNEYEHIIGYKKLTDKFYYLREQAEIEAHMYQQAIDDIERAITLAPSEYLYHVEKAALMFRTAQVDLAIKSAQKAIAIKADEIDAYRILGIIYGELKNKEKAAENLNKAKDLGDKQAESLLNKYTK